MMLWVLEQLRASGRAGDIVGHSSYRHPLFVDIEPARAAAGLCRQQPFCC
jgi:hypothetical protein